jgi:mRNA interferase MazF
MHQKDFAGWSTLKQKLHVRKEKGLPSIKEREILWCSIGVNIGDEQDGHNKLYNRPVLVIRKFNRHLFWGLPLTSKEKTNKYYFPLNFKGAKHTDKKSFALLSHLRLYDVKRIISHDALIGTLPHEQFEAVRAAIKELL